MPDRSSRARQEYNFFRFRQFCRAIKLLDGTTAWLRVFIVHQFDIDFPSRRIMTLLDQNCLWSEDDHSNGNSVEID